MTQDDEYITCYVAFLDILGFKDKLKKLSCRDILGIFDAIREVKDWMENTKIRKIFNSDGYIHIGENIKMKIMSDSICFYIEANLPHALFNLLLCCGRFQTKLLELSEPILIRGAITIGDLYAKGDIIFGPALVEAYSLQEKICKYPRIIITGVTIDHATGQTTEEKVRERFNNLVFRDIDAFFTINQIGLGDQWDLNGEYYTKFKEHILQILDSTIDSSIREKYLYLQKRFLERYDL